MQRITGTVAGAVVASFVMLALYTPTITFSHHLLLAGWTFVCGMFRGNSASAYGALVAIITPYIAILAASAPPASVELWVFRRISQNVLGVMVFVVVELVIWPSYATHAFRDELAGAALGAPAQITQRQPQLAVRWPQREEEGVAEGEEGTREGGTEE